MSTNGKLGEQMGKLMKQWLFAVVALFLASCSSEIFTESGKTENESINLEITARQELLQGDGNAFETTRTAMSPTDGGASINWVEGDFINVYDGTSMRKFVASSVEGTTCTFKAQGYGVSKTANNYLACYPYNMKQTFSGNIISNVTLPANQLAVAGGFDPACNLMVAKTNAISNGFDFKNICSYLIIKPGFDCSRIVIKFNDESAQVAGTFDVTMGDDGTPSISNLSATSNQIELLGDIKQGNEYYVAILPGTYSDGFRVTLEPVASASDIDWENHKVNLNTQYKETANPITVNRSKIKSLGLLKDGLTSSTGQDAYFVDIFDAQNQTSGSIVLWAKYNLDAESETEDGGHYAWGEIEPKSSYTEENYLCKDYYPSTLDKNHDAAAVRLGEGWKIPSQADFRQLVNNTIWVYTQNYNNTDKAGYIIYPAGETSAGTVVKGYQMNVSEKVYPVTASKCDETTEITNNEITGYIKGLNLNDKHLFLPRSGAIVGTEPELKCAYWTNTHGTGEITSSNPDWKGQRAAYYFGADGGGGFHPNSVWSTIYQGLSIRPVFVLNR